MIEVAVAEPVMIFVESTPIFELFAVIFVAVIPGAVKLTNDELPYIFSFNNGVVLAPKIKDPV